MSKYDNLWRYIKNCGQGEITLTFAEIGEITDIPLTTPFAVQKGTDGTRVGGQQNIHERTEGDI